MDPLQIAVMTQAAGRTDSVSSALPGAPVVPHTPLRRVRLREGAARMLHGLADAVAPQRTPEPVVRRLPACTQVRAH
jgi:hypothetical protein